MAAPGFVADLFANPTALMAMAWVSADFDALIGALFALQVALKTAIDGQLVRWVRGTPMALRHLAWAPIKDLLMLAVWCYSIFSRSVEWRGVRLRMGPDSQLLPDEGALPIRVLRRLLNA
jgi:ceramide glucosyltransferase